MIIHRAYKTELDPNNKQKTWFLKCAGTARYTFNWALADRIERYKQGLKNNKYEQKKRFNAIKPQWLYETPYTIQEQAFENVDLAYQNFFRRVKQGEKPGFPKFKSRKDGIGSSTLRANIHVESGRIKLPRIGWVRLKEHGYIPQDEKILSVTISEQAGRWYASVLIEQEVPEPMYANGTTVGVDLGIKTLAVCSDGTKFENPKALARYERKLKRLQREWSRRKRGSQNRAKTKRKLAKCYAKVANVRSHAVHEVTSYLTKSKLIGTIVIEDLNVAGMVKNHCLAKAISDVAFGEFRRQAEYKSKWTGKQLVVAERFYKSSKLCSVCGAENKELTLSDRTWVCLNCGTLHDRDENASKNLEQYPAVKQTEIACGVTSLEGCTVKQEASHRNLEHQSRKPARVHPTRA